MADGFIWGSITYFGVLLTTGLIVKAYVSLTR